MKKVSFLRPFDLCLINDEREKETGRKATFYSRFNCTEECRSTVDIQLGGDVGGGGGEHGEQDGSRGGLEAKHGTYFHIAFPHLQLWGSGFSVREQGQVDGGRLRNPSQTVSATNANECARFHRRSLWARFVLLLEDGDSGRWVDGWWRQMGIDRVKGKQECSSPCSLIVSSSGWWS